MIYCSDLDGQLYQINDYEGFIRECGEELWDMYVVNSINYNISYTLKSLEESGIVVQTANEKDDYFYLEDLKKSVNIMAESINIIYGPEKLAECNKRIEGALSNKNGNSNR